MPVRSPLLRRSAAAVALALLAHALPVSAQTAQPTAQAPAAAGAASAAPEPGMPPIREARVAENAFIRGAPLPDWAEPLAELPAAIARKDPVVMRVSDRQYWLGPTPAVLSHRAIQVTASSALSDIGQLPLAFVPQYQQILLHSVKILRGNDVLDRTTSAQVRFLERETGLEIGIYSGTVTAVLLLEDVRVGDTLQIISTTVGHNPVFGKFFSDSTSWDSDWPVDLRRVTVLHPPERKVHWKMHGDQQATAIEPQRLTRNNGWQGLRFEARDLAPIDREPDVPSDHFLYRWLQLSEYDSWQQVARWADTLFVIPQQLPVALAPVMAKLRALPTQQEQVAAALHWVQEEIRYFSVSLGESSHRPYPPETVLQRRYGDCKDKTLLLVAMLRNLGIQADPMLVSLQSPRLASKTLPAPEVFDHAIVRVHLNNQDWYLDGTRLGQPSPLALQGKTLLTASGLTVTPNTRELTTITSTQRSHPFNQELNEQLTIVDFDKPATLEMTRRYNGLSAEGLRMALSQLRPSQLRSGITSDYERRYPGIVMQGEPKIDDDVANNSVVLRATFSIPDAAKSSGEAWGVRYFPNTLVGVVSLPQKVQRSAPALVQDPNFRTRYQMTMTFPERVSVMEDPRKRTLSTEFFRSQVETSFRGNVASVQADFEALKDIAKPSELKSLMEDVKRLENHVGSVMVVTKAALKAEAKEGAGQPTGAAGVQANLAQRLDKHIATLDKVIKSNRLKGEDLAEAYCDRAHAHADKGLPDKGMADAEEAVKLAPELSSGWFCRANMRFALGDFQAAVIDYTKALRLGADPVMGYFRRGHARFFAGQFKLAAQDFAQAAKDDQADNAPFSQLWQVISLQRAAEPIPDALQSKAAAFASAAWPQPAIALQLGALDVDGFMKTLANKRGDDLEMTLSEAWFFIGQHHVTAGRKDEALNAFDRSLAQGITVYIEHVASGHEKQRLMGAGR